MANFDEDSQPLSFLYNNFNVLVENIIVDGAGNMFSELQPFFVGLSLIWVVSYGYSIMYGWIDVSVKRQSRDVVIFCVLNFMFFQYEVLISNAKELFIDQPSVIASLVTGNQSNTGGPFASLDKIIGVAFTYLWNTMDGRKIFGSIGPSLLAFIMCGFVMYLCLNALYTIMKCVFFLILLLVASPVPIIFSIFEQTRQFAVAWIVQMVSFSFLIFFVTLLIGFIAVMGGEILLNVGSSLDEKGSGLTSTDLVLVLMLTFVGGKAIEEVGILSQSISGGIGTKVKENISDINIPNPFKDKGEAGNNG